MLNRITSEILEEISKSPLTWAVRYNTLWHYKRKENNVFSMASLLFILKEIYDLVEVTSQRDIDKITAFLLPVFELYKNKDGRATYNFYQTRPSQHFPNGYLMQYFDHFRLPDDIDDTALITYITNAPLADVMHLKDLTDSFAQNFPDGKRIYNTWYGKTMPKEQDVCTLLNLFYLVFHHTIPLNQTDKDSFNFLIEKIDFIRNKPFEIARHYANPALILYHYARFMGRFSSPLDDSKPKIIQTIYAVLEDETVYMNRLILETSLIKLGVSRSPLDLEKLTFKDFYTFIGAPLAPFSGIIAKKASSLKATQMFWDCEMHNKALVLEYLAWSRHNTKQLY
jgi:hypothetical protein